MDSWRTIILAGGKGTRMKSSTPKMLHNICGKPMVALVAGAISGAGIDNITVVIPQGDSRISDVIGNGQNFVEQSEPLGTGHALLEARTSFDGYNGNVLVINGDMPLVTSDTISSLVKSHESNGHQLTFLTFDSIIDKDMGRVVRGNDGEITGIVEREDLVIEAGSGHEVNIGVYCFQAPLLWDILAQLPQTNNGEIYLTSLVSMYSSMGYSVGNVALEDPLEGVGVNDGVQLANARDVMQKRINRGWLLRGVTVMEPAYIDSDVKLEQDVFIFPNTFIYGDTTIKRESQIGPGSTIVNSYISQGCKVVNSTIEGALLEEGVDVGPYSHIRPESHIGKDVHVGNFAEIKKSILGHDTQIGHFSYVGDAWVGSNVNIGAGSITCNFDGVNKNQTVIEDGAFIGSDSMLVAPVRIGAGSSTSAGSVITRDVPPASQAIGMPARIFPKNKQ